MLIFERLLSPTAPHSPIPVQRPLSADHWPDKAVRAIYAKSSHLAHDDASFGLAIYAYVSYRSRYFGYHTIRAGPQRPVYPHISQGQGCIRDIIRPPHTPAQ